MLLHFKKISDEDFPFANDVECVASAYNKMNILKIHNEFLVNSIEDMDFDKLFYIDLQTKEILNKEITNFQKKLT